MNLSYDLEVQERIIVIGLTLHPNTIEEWYYNNDQVDMLDGQRS